MNRTTDHAYTVSIDTCGPTPGVALLRTTKAGPELLGESYLKEERPRGERVAELLSALLDQADIGVANVGGYGVATGPGSYTGVRIGLALVRGLTLLEAVPVVGIGNLDLAVAAHDAQGASARGGLVCAALPAGGGRLYTATFGAAQDAESERPVLLAPDLLEIGAAGAALQGLDHALGDVVVVGEGAEDLVTAVGGSRIGIGDCPGGRAGVLAVLAAAALEKGQGATADTVLPAYVGPDQASPNRNRVAPAAAGLKRRVSTAPNGS